MPNFNVIVQLPFRTSDEAFEYQEFLFEELNIDNPPPEVLRAENGWVTTVLVKTDNKGEAERTAAVLREAAIWKSRTPSVFIQSTTGGVEAPEPAIKALVDVERLSEARRRYDLSPKAIAYRKNFRDTAAFKRSQRNYQQSSLGRAAQKRYAESERGKSARAIYQSSEKGKAARAAYQKRRRDAIKALLEAETPESGE